MERFKQEPRAENLNSFRGWLLAFLIFHVPLALYNVTAGIYALAAYLKVGANLIFAALSVLLCFLLPLALVLLLKRKRLFRYFYLGYSVVMAANYLVVQGVNATTVVFAALFTVPWLLYVFQSRRVQAVLDAAHPLCGADPEKNDESK